MKLNEWIKAAREYANLTQEQVGEHLDRTKGIVSHWEKGKNEPPYTLLLKLAEITGYREPLPGTERFFSSGDWPFESVNRADFDRLPADTKEDIADYIQLKISKNKSHGPEATAA